MNAALLGFIGVLTGGALSIAKDVVVEGRRESRTRDRELRQEHAEARTACRLVGAELGTLADNFSEILQRRRFPLRTPGEQGSFLPWREWEAHKGVLARMIESDKTWQEIVGIYTNARALRHRLSVDEPGLSLPEKFTPLLVQDAPLAQRLSNELLAAASGSGASP